MLKSILILVMVDLIFLKLASNHFNYQVRIIQGNDIKLKIIPAILAYIFMGLGLKKIIIDNNLSSQEAFLMGLVIYGTFESTNMAIFDKWNIKSFIIDTIWGAILFYLSSKIYKKINL